MLFCCLVVGEKKKGEKSIRRATKTEQRDCSMGSSENNFGLFSPPPSGLCLESSFFVCSAGAEKRKRERKMEAGAEGDISFHLNVFWKSNKTRGKVKNHRGLLKRFKGGRKWIINPRHFNTLKVRSGPFFLLFCSAYLFLDMLANFCCLLSLGRERSEKSF